MPKRTPRPRTAPLGAVLGLALAPLAIGVPQDGATSDAPPPVARVENYVPQTEYEKVLWRNFTDNFVAVVGEELLTQTEIIRAATELPPEEDPTAGREDLEPMQAFELKFAKALELAVERRLKMSGGRNLGFETDFVDRVRTDFMRERIAQMGGAASAGAQLRQSGMTIGSFEKMIGESLYMKVWEDAQTGRGAGPTGRKVVDDFVRPGELYALYRDSARSRNAEALALIGQRSEQIVLRRLVLVVPSVAEADVTRQRADALHANLENGILDFDTAVSEYSPAPIRGKDSYTPALPAEELRRQLVDRHGQAEALGTYFEDLQVGDLTPVLEYREPSGALSLLVVYRADRVEAATAAQPFSDPELQARLRETIEDKSAELQVERGLAGLARSTFVLPPQVRGQFLDRGRRVAR